MSCPYCGKAGEEAGLLCDDDHCREDVSELVSLVQLPPSDADLDKFHTTWIRCSGCGETVDGNNHACRFAV